MAQTTNEPVEHLNEGSGNGEVRSNGNRALMVRDYDMGAISPYLASSPSGPYLDGAPTGVNFSQLLHALRRRWLLAVIAGLTVSLPLAALVWLITPENYEVVAWLRVGDPPQMDTRYGRRDPAEYEQYRKTQAARIKSPLVLAGALRQPGITDQPMVRAEKEPLKFLEEEVIVASPLESEVLQIKMRGRDARQLVKIVNAVKKSYLDNVVDAERALVRGRQDLLQRSLTDKNSEISRKRDTLYNLQQNLNVADSEQGRMRATILLHETSAIMQQMNEAEKNLTEVKTKLALIEERERNGYQPPEYTIERIVSNDEVVAKSRREILELEQVISHEKRIARDPRRNPAIKRYEAMRADAQDRLDKRIAEIKPGIIKFIQSQGTGGDELGDPKQLTVKQDLLASELERLQEKYRLSKEESAKYGVTSAELGALEVQIKEAENYRASLAEKLEQVNLELRLPSRVTPLEDASEPEGTNPVFRYVITIFAGLMGLVVGAGSVVALEYNAHRLNTAGEVSSRTGLRVLGTVPNLESLSRTKGLNGSSALEGILAESVDSVRTILLQQSRDDSKQVILVTSAGDREGKSTVATHLAASLARAGRRTLLVDGDLRSPTVHAMFGAAAEPGICEMLRGEVDLEAAIQPTQIDGLMLVAAGQCDYQAIAALAKNPLESTLQKARQQFEFIVIDSAPVLAYADTLLMGGHVDAAVLSVRRDVSQLHKVYEARERLESVGIRVLGAVVNGINEVSRRPAFALPSSN